MSSTCPICQQEISADMAVCPTCGFRLQGTTQKFEPIPIDLNNPTGKPEPAAEAILKVIRGPQTGVSYELTGKENTVGRSPKCSIFLNDMTVSRQHATITFESGVFVIRDDNSFNGVWINNVNVEAKALAPGDIIQIGAFCLKYEEN